jgi:hypothetical protein
MTPCLDSTSDLAGRYLIKLEGAVWEPMSIAGQPLEGVFKCLLVSTPEHWESYWMKMCPETRSVIHRHTANEMLLVMQGSVQDSDGSVFRASDVIVYPADSSHVLFSPEGCMLLVVESRASTGV